MRAEQKNLTILSLAGLFLISCGFSPVIPDTSTESAQRLTWRRSLPVEYKIASSIPEDLREEVRAGFDAWNTATGTQVFVYGGVKELDETQLSPEFTMEENVVLATNQGGGELNPETGAYSASPLARTFLRGGTSVRDSDIYLFEFDQNYLSGRPDTGDIYSVRDVIAHEAGHILFGPDHSTDPESIMTPALYPMGSPEEKSSPAPCDIEQFLSVYSNLSS